MQRPNNSFADDASATRHHKFRTAMIGVAILVGLVLIGFLHLAGASPHGQ